MEIVEVRGCIGYCGFFVQEPYDMYCDHPNLKDFDFVKKHFPKSISTAKYGPTKGEKYVDPYVGHFVSREDSSNGKVPKECPLRVAPFEVHTIYKLKVGK